MAESAIARYSFNPLDDDSTLHYSSDESASLSDAYFQTTSRFSPPLTYSPDDAGHKRADDPIYSLPQLPQFTHSAKYGSFVGPTYYSVYGNMDRAISDRSVCSEESPLRFFHKREISQAIHEEYPQQDLTSSATLQDDEVDQLQPSRHSKHLSRQDLRRYHRQVRMEHQARELKVRQIRGRPQSIMPSRQDTMWAVIFIIQLLVIVSCAIKWGSAMLLVHDGNSAQNVGERSRLMVGIDSDDDVLLVQFLGSGEEALSMEPILGIPSLSVDYRAVISTCGMCGLYAFILSALTTGFMLIIAKSLIQTALVFSILLALSWGLIGIAIQPFLVIIPVMGFVSLLLTVTYTIWVWDRIPFAATNLYIALCAIRCTADVTLMGMSMMLVSMGWCLLWITACIGVVENIDMTKGATMVVYTLFLASFCWTNLVIKVRQSSFGDTIT